MAVVQNGAIVKTGSAAVATTGANSLQVGGFLKSIPSNPVTGGGAMFLTTSGAATTASTEATHVVMPLGSTSAAICDAIARQSGQLVAPATTDPTAATVSEFTAAATRPSGCLKVAATGVGALTNGEHYVFSRI